MNTHQIIESLHIYFQQHPQMGLIFAFVTAFLESMPIIGTIVPGAITMTMVGWMIGSGFVSPSLTLGLASLGALTGDYIGFVFGKCYHDRIDKLWPFYRFPQIISKSRVFFDKHGGKSILIGRFVGPARSTVPLVAGLLRMSWLRFSISVIPTAILWAIVYALPGIILGAFATDIPPALLTEYLVIGAIIIVGIWALIWIIQYFFNGIQNFYHEQIDSYWYFLDNYRGTRLITKYIRNCKAPHSHHQLSRVLLTSVYASVFLIISLNVMWHTSLTQINNIIFHFTQSLRIYPINTLFAIISSLGKPIVVLSLGITLAGLLILHKQWRAGIHLAMAMLGATAAVIIFKHAIYHARPTGMMLTELTSSFPSGHTTLSTVLFSLLAFWTARYFRKSRLTVYAPFALLILTIGFSRLLLGAHWFLDVMAGLFLGQTITLITLINYQRNPCHTTAEKLPAWLWISYMLVGFALINGGYAAMNYKLVRFQSTPFKKLQYIQQKSWWENPLCFTPTFRRNRLGFPVQPLNIQIAAPLQSIQQQLKKSNWHIISRHKHLTDTFYRLTNQLPQYHLPLFELLFKNERPSLVAYHETPNPNFVRIIRIWNTNIILQPQHTPIWIGMITTLKAPPHRLALPHGSLSSFPPINLEKIFISSSKNWHWKSVSTTKSLPKNIKHLDWNGRVAVIYKS